MEILCAQTGAMQVNTYLLWKNRQAVLIDPGDDAAELMACLEERGLMLTHILLTHGHFDHIGAVAELKERTGACICIGAEDERMLFDPELNLSARFEMPVRACRADCLLHDGDMLETPVAKFCVIATPGHTPGGVCYICGERIFSGDTLFYSSVGRTDFPGGDQQALYKSIQEKLFVLQGYFEVFPGHGNATTLLREKIENPFVGSGE